MKLSLCISMWVLVFCISFSRFAAGSPSSLDSLDLVDYLSKNDAGIENQYPDPVDQEMNDRIRVWKRVRCHILNLGGMCHSAKAAELADQARWLRRPGGPGRR